MTGEPHLELLDRPVEIFRDEIDDDSDDKETKGGDTKLDNAIRARMGELAAAEGKTVEHFTMHGLRHTVKTGIAKSGS